MQRNFDFLGRGKVRFFHILRVRFERVKYGKPSSQDPKSQISASMFLIFWVFVTFLSIFFAIWILEFYGAWHGNFFFCRQKKIKFLCRKHNRTTDTESDKNPENQFSFFCLVLILVWINGRLKWSTFYYLYQFYFS